MTRPEYDTAVVVVVDVKLLMTVWFAMELLGFVKSNFAGYERATFALVFVAADVFVLGRPLQENLASQCHPFFHDSSQ